VLDNVAEIEPSQTFSQPPHLYLNDGHGRFTEQGAELGSWFRGRYVARGLAVGDLDDDGALDWVVACNGGPPAILENRLARGRHWLGVRLEGAGGNRAAIGALVELRVGGRVLREEVRGASSFGGFGDLRVHFGLGEADHAEALRVRWPDGSDTLLENPEVDRYHRIGPPPSSPRR
jgi:hypothetical protein